MHFEPINVQPPSSALRHRLRWLFAGFVVLLLTVYGRLIALEMRDGSEYRKMAAEPTIRRQTVPGMRGRILARDGTVLAYDQPLVDLAINYRWLEEPADARWLLRMARGRLTPAERRDSIRVAQEEQEFLTERRELWQRLASLCGMTDEQWRDRCEQIQRRVENVANGVNARRLNERNADRQLLDNAASANSLLGWLSMVGRSVGEALSACDDAVQPRPLTVEEELADHVVCQDLPLEVVAEIETHPQSYPGATLVHSYQRAYPEGDLAAHVVGYLGLTNADEVSAATNQPGAYQADDWLGRAGIERQYEKSLRGRRGLTLLELDARERAAKTTIARQAGTGKDVVLTLDPALQRTAQTLLDEAIARRLPSGDSRLDASAGGAIVALDVRSGAILAAAGAPRFNPGSFTAVDSEAIQGWLGDPARPLFNRTVQMALPPGSVFKVISAAALLDRGIQPDAPYECQGYLHKADALRCAVYRRFGIGHGPVTMEDALARSCNVYFFHYAEQIGVLPLVDWAGRLGLGKATGVDLPGEVSGNVPVVSTANETTSRSDPLMVCIGQGPITATPLQVVRMIAAIANGGYLITPHVTLRLESPTGERAAGNDRRSPSSVAELAWPKPRPISGLTPAMMTIIRKGLRQTVEDEQGTAHALIDVSHVTVAGKTGTAETGGDQPENSWFVGYAPADQPQVAFVVVLERGGNSAPATGPVVDYLVKRMNDLGYFGPQREQMASSLDRAVGRNTPERNSLIK